MIGERTGGHFEYGEVVRFVLPRTRLTWDVPTKRNYVSPPIEGVGLPVDVYLAGELQGAAATDLLDVLRRLPGRDRLRKLSW